jgi:hypothetical protein
LKSSRIVGEFAKSQAARDFGDPPPFHISPNALSQTAVQKQFLTPES